MRLFSGLNNLRDVTLDPRYSAVCGYTEADLDTVFAPELPGLDRDEIRRWYNGYNWLGGEKVYNPFDILLLFSSVPHFPAYNPRMHAAYDRLLADLVAACKGRYGAGLRAVAVYGSVGRGLPRPDSDVDLLIVAEGLADRHVLRVRDFRAVEALLAPGLDAAAASGLHPDLSPVMMTPAELERGSMLLLDMTEDARILFDADGGLGRALDRLRGRLRELGSRRVWLGNAWYWDLKPDYRPGDVFDLFTP